MNASKLKLICQAIITYCCLVSLAADLPAQSDCARCMTPVPSGITNRQLTPWTGIVTRYQPERIRIQGTPPVSSPYYSQNPSDTDQGQPTLFAPMQQDLRLVPTEPVAPTSRELNSPNPKLLEKIGQRYSDPRVIRMLGQLNPQTSESFYQEVSELIDERHLQPANYARRVDNALDHLTRALEVPAFVKSAHVQGTQSEIAAFQDELQRMRTEIKVRNSRDARTVMRDVQKRAKRSISINPAAIGLEFLYGATDSLDQFSMLLPPEKTGGPSVGLRDNVVGIGVEIESNPAGLKILKLIPGGPAAQADLRSGDIITHIDGRELKSLDLNRSADLIIGPVGTPIQIQASRGNRTGSVTLVRQKMVLHSVVDARIQDATQGIAYLKLEQFAESTMNEIDSALMKLHQQGMKSLILDLRGNPGGLLTTAIELSDRFLPVGTIVATRGRTPDDNTLETAHFGNTWKMPLVVLIDHNSASASEIFAAAIQDYHRGIIVGEISYGKGTVQTLFPLHTFPAALRLTTAKFYSPDGREMAGVGVTPDVKVSGEATKTGSSDASLDEALHQIVAPQTRALSERFRRSGDITVETGISV